MLEGACRAHLMVSMGDRATFFSTGDQEEGGGCSHLGGDAQITLLSGGFAGVPHTCVCPRQPKGCVQGGASQGESTLPLNSLPPRNSTTELLGKNNYLLADLLYFSKNKTKKSVLTEKIYIFQAFKKKTMKGEKICCVRHFCKCHLKLFFL